MVRDATSTRTKREEAFSTEVASTSAPSSSNPAPNPSLVTPVRIHTTKKIRSFLNAFADDPKFPEDARDRVRPWANRDEVPWDVLDEACRLSSSSNTSPSSSNSSATRTPTLSELVFEGGIALKEPPPRVRSKELEERLARLQRELDERVYKDMVKGVTRKEDEARDHQDGAFKTYKDQLGFGVNVIFTMFTLFVFCYFVARSVTQSEPMRMLAGLCGCIFAMLMETTLLITRTTYTLRDRIQFSKKYF